MQDKKVFAALDQKFDTAPTSMPVVKQEESLVEDDFEQARTALKQMISKGQTAVDDIMSIARQSDHPRAFEVTGQLIKTVAETAKDLLALQKQKKDLTTIAGPEAPKQIGTQNNIVFSGSTNDLLKLLKNKDEKVIDASDSSSPT
jgi:hypothetical protein